MLTLGSLFDGIGGFPLAATMCGIEPVWASEIEEFPIAVTKKHFPNMKHLGDVTKIDGSKIQPVDIITFGFPCQDLSVAGKRSSIKHSQLGDEETTRSGLFFEAIRIIKEMRDATRTDDIIRPRFAMFENVPGIFSAKTNGIKGETFRIVVEEMCKLAEAEVTIPKPTDGKWNSAGLVVGSKWSFGWRTVDAQYYGVAQRRRRVYAVLDFAGQGAREILFVDKSLRGNSSQKPYSWESFAEYPDGSIGVSD